MCDPVTLIMGLASVASGALGLAQKPPKPPKPEVPAVAAPETRNPAAVVRVGAADGNTNKDKNAPDENGVFMEQRASGKALGGLGRGGLAL